MDSDILKIAAKLRPGTAWTLRDGNLIQAEDGTPRVDTPTREELLEGMNAVRYRDLRRPEYPPVGDQLDEIWKWLKNPTHDLRPMIQKIFSVKDRHTKP